MSKPYDATAKDLIETDPAGWVSFLGCAVPASAVHLVDADVSTVTTDADKVIRVDEPEPWVLHIDIQASWEAGLDRRLLRYNALLHHRHAVPVASVLVILRPSANVTALTGTLDVCPPVGAPWAFRYEVLRVWQRTVEEFLRGPLGLLPLAPLAGVSATDLPTIVDGMKTRVAAVPDGALVAKIWAATYVLLGLRFESAVIDNVLEGVMQMEESTTYQAIIRRGMAAGRAEGRAEEARHVLSRQGRKKFGPPTAAQEAALAAITDLARLEDLSEKVLDVNTWDELLAGA